MPARYSIKDRRKFQRLELNITVYYRIKEPLNIKVMVGDKEIEATMLNISAGGMGIVTKLNIPAYSIILIKITLAKMDKQGKLSSSEPMEVVGEVRYNVLEDDKQYRLGIRFIGIEKQDQVKIENFIKITLSP